MQLKRMFSTDGVKGTRNYLDTQKKYEIIRTIIYFAVSISLFLAGYFRLGADMERLEGSGDEIVQEETGEAGDKDVRGINLLQIVAVLGCLPASKSAVGAIMFLRFKSCGAQAADEIERHCQGLEGLYDMAFTSYKKNFMVSHMTVCGGTVCGFTEDGAFEENEFYQHIGGILKLDGHKNVTVKIFTSLPRYTERLEQMKSLEPDEARTKAVVSTLKSVVL